MKRLAGRGLAFADFERSIGSRYSRDGRCPSSDGREEVDKPVCDLVRVLSRNFGLWLVGSGRGGSSRSTTSVVLLERLSNLGGGSFSDGIRHTGRCVTSEVFGIGGEGLGAVMVPVEIILGF
jgi:hypothetical protein